MSNVAVLNPGGAEPNDTAEYEECLLAAVLGGYEDVPGLARVLGNTDGAFYSPLRGGMWEAMLKVHRAGLSIEPVIVKDTMIKAGLRFDPLWVITIYAKPGVLSVQAPYYAERVRAAARLRQIRDIGVRMIQAGERTDADPDAILGYVGNWVSELLGSDQGESIDTWTALQQAIVDPEHGDPQSLKTPWASLNTILGGLFPGQLVVIGGRPGKGKSIMLENLATGIARDCTGCQSLYITLEMSAKELMQRTLAWTARVPLSLIRAGTYDDAQAVALAEASTVIGDTPIEFVDRGYMTVDEIRSAAWAARQRATRAGRRLAIVAIDYAGLVELRQWNGATRQQQIGEMTRALKRIAKELGVTIVIGVQLNRVIEHRRNKVPMLSDLKEAGDYEQDADVVLLIDPEETTDEQGRVISSGAADFIVAKNRNGPEGTTRVQFYGAYTRFWEN